MSKAEERAFERCPKSDYAINEMRNERKRAIFIEGYHQAEKDLELSWEDVKLLQNISSEVFAEVAHGSVDYYQIYPTEQSFIEEVLKRFKERKEK